MQSNTAIYKQTRVKHNRLLLVLNKKTRRGFLVERDIVCIANYLLNQIICMS